MKKLLLFGLLSLCAMFVACNTPNNGEDPTEEPVVVEKVTLDPSSVELLIGQTVQLSLVVEPADTECYVTWSSSNKDVATINAKGEVTGVASGAAMIMVMAGDKSASCMVTVVGVPVESISLSESYIEIDELGQRTLVATVLPENADNKSVTWTSSDELVAKVSGSGTVTGMKGGEAVITAKAGNQTAECHVKVNTLPLAVGDIYYSDGTWSKALDAGKTPIGVVYYVGDVTKQDAALAREHPECTHGLVVCLTENFEGLTSIVWQENFREYDHMIDWWLKDCIYETILSGKGIDDPINKTVGYNNTKAIELFNEAPENAEWKVNVVEYIKEYRTLVPAPEHSSDWYLPSPKELSLLITGEFDDNIWDIRMGGGDDGTAPSGSNDRLKDINEVMATIPGALGLGHRIPVGMMMYWSSTEVESLEPGVPEGYTHMAIAVVTNNGQTPQCAKDETYPVSVRAVLAF